MCCNDVLIQKCFNLIFHFQVCAKFPQRRVHLPRTEAVHRDEVPRLSNIRFRRELFLLYKPMADCRHGMGFRTFKESRVKTLDYYLNY